MDDYHHRFIVHPTGNDDLAYIGWEVATEEGLEAMAAQGKLMPTEATDLQKCSQAAGIGREAFVGAYA